MIGKELSRESEEAMNASTQFMEKDIEQRYNILNHIEELKSKNYKIAVEQCLIESESIGRLTLVDISAVKGNYQEEDEWVEFDHVYVNQTTDGGFTGDEFAGHIYVPITKKLYLKSYYSM